MTLSLLIGKLPSDYSWFGKCPLFGKLDLGLTPLLSHMLSAQPLPWTATSLVQDTEVADLVSLFLGPWFIAEMVESVEVGVRNRV